MIKLKFIGEDGTYGLTKDKIYDVEVFSQGSYIWVRWGSSPGPGCTGYMSTRGFANNWETPTQ